MVRAAIDPIEAAVRPRWRWAISALTGVAVGWGLGLAIALPLLGILRALDVDLGLSDLFWAAFAGPMLATVLAGVFVARSRRHTGDTPARARTVATISALTLVLGWFGSPMLFHGATRSTLAWAVWPALVAIAVATAIPSSPATGSGPTTSS